LVGGLIYLLIDTTSGPGGPGDANAQIILGPTLITAATIVASLQIVLSWLAGFGEDDTVTKKRYYVAFYVTGTILTAALAFLLVTLSLSIPNLTVAVTSISILLLAASILSCKRYLSSGISFEH
jgi:lysylphosphatidylglycerol synthetase-like protein (DUF2156 family)